MKRLDLLTPPPSDRYRPFLDAAESNKLDVILYLSSISPTNIIMINKALYAASHRCHHDIVKYLILQGATDLEQCLPNLIPSSSLQQIKEILQISNWIPDWDRCLRKAAGYSRLDQCQWFIEQGAEDLNLALEAAAGYGDVQTLEWLINHGASDLDTALYCAALEGNLEVVDYLLTAGATGVNSAIIQAAREGHLEIVQHLVSSGATELEEPFNEAVRKLHLDVIAYLARCRRSKMSREFLQAIEDGHQNLIRHLIRHQFIDPNEALVTATLSGDLELVVYLVSEGATHLHRPLKDATKYGLLPILRFLLHHLPPDADPKLNQLLQIAASRGYYDVVQYLVAYGTDTGCHDFTGVLAVAKDGSSLRLLRYLISIPEMEPEVETN
jgi:ankyrin repeat protein